MTTPIIITTAITGAIPCKAGNPAVPTTPSEQFEVNKWCLEPGGHTRTGFEDNVVAGKGKLASSNAGLVTLVVDVAHEYGRHPATPTEARQLPGLAKN